MTRQEITLVLARDRRFLVAVKLNAAEREALERLADAEHFPMSQVVRRLIWHAAEDVASHSREVSP